MKWFAVLLVMLLTGMAPAADLSVPAAVKGEPGDFITISATTTSPVVKWVVLDPGIKLFPTQLLKDTKTAIVVGNTPGTYRVLAYTADAAGPSEPAITLVTIQGSPSPPAPPPVPPNPSAPIPAEGFRALFLYDTATVTALPRAQQDVLFAASIRDYLNSKTVKGDQTKTPEWRMWDAGVDASQESQLWQDALKRKRGALPWLVISNGKSGFEGPLPATVDETLTLLKKYGG